MSNYIENQHQALWGFHMTVKNGCASMKQKQIFIMKLKYVCVYTIYVCVCV